MKNIKICLLLISFFNILLSMEKHKELVSKIYHTVENNHKDLALLYTWSYYAPGAVYCFPENYSLQNDLAMPHLHDSQQNGYINGNFEIMSTWGNAIESLAQEGITKMIAPGHKSFNTLRLVQSNGNHACNKYIYHTRMNSDNTISVSVAQKDQFKKKLSITKNNITPYFEGTFQIPSAHSYFTFTNNPFFVGIMHINNKNTVKVQFNYSAPSSLYNTTFKGIGIIKACGENNRLLDLTITVGDKKLYTYSDDGETKTRTFHNS